MHIFNKEKENGLASLIENNNVIAFASPCLPESSKESLKDIDKKIDLSNFASASEDDFDVYKTYSILVSSSWNQNDDVFDPTELILAANTPVYKPTNIEHDEKVIVGNMIGNWLIDDEYKPIEASEVKDDALIHLLVGSVIYKQWRDPEYKKRSEKLIEEIIAGDMFVSMECMFKGFDYAIRTPDGEHKIVARSEETAFLSKYLRSYGGSGEYQEHQVGRLLRNIVFTGKGYVKKPANSDSIIFNNKHNFNFTKASKQDFFTETDNMSEELKTEIARLQSELKESQASNKALEQKLSEKNTDGLKETLAKLEKENKELNDKLVAESSVKESFEAKASETEAELVKSKEAYDKLEAEYKDMKKKEKMDERKAMLKKAGMKDKDAEEKSKAFADVEDSIFESFVDTIAKLQTVATPAKEEDSNASEEVLDEVVENSEASLSVESDDSNAAADEMESTIASVGEWFKKSVLNKE